MRNETLNYIETPSDTTNPTFVGMIGRKYAIACRVEAEIKFYGMEKPDGVA